MPNLCVKVAPSGTNLCTVSGVGACSFLPQNQVILIDPSCSSGLVIADTTAPVDTTRVQDMSIVFGLALVALAGVWGSKQLIKLFSADLER